MNTVLRRRTCPIATTNVDCSARDGWSVRHPLGERTTVIISTSGGDQMKVTGVDVQIVSVPFVHPETWRFGRMWGLTNAIIDGGQVLPESPYFV